MGVIALIFLFIIVLSLSAARGKKEKDKVSFHGIALVAGLGLFIAVEMML